MTGREPHKGVNPDEVVAVGAAIQAGVLSGDVKDVLLLDVTPLSLGIETKGGVFTKLIERNTTIPTKKSEVFSTADDNQNQVEIHVLQGEREMAAYNRTLGKFNLVGIPPAPRGVPQIEVTFDIDANGIVHVGAKDLGTGNEQKIEIKASSGLSDEEITGMVRDAESHADEDKRLRRVADARNAAEARVHEAERQLKDNGDKVDESVRRDLEGAIEAAKGAAAGEDPDDMEAKTAGLTDVLHRLSEQVYQQAAAEQEPGGRQRRGRERRNRRGRRVRGHRRGRPEGVLIQTKPRGGPAMPAVARFDPFRDITTLRDEMNRLFSRTVGDGVSSGSAWTPAVDIFDTDQAIVLRAELPGLAPEDIDIEIDDNVLSLKGERRFQEEVEEGRYYRLERAYGHFQRNVTLPQGVKAEEISASFDNGVLSVRVPKAEEIRPRKIAVETLGPAVAELETA